MPVTESVTGVFVFLLNIICYDPAMGKKMARIGVLLAVFISAASTVCVAGDGADTLVNRIYASGGGTLYCQAPFSAGDRGVRADYLYGSHLMLRHFNCITVRQCEKKPGYAAVANDLHNLYPIQRSVEIDRRGSQFGDLPPDSRQSDCGYKLSFQTFEPPDHAKGNIARAVLYMHKQHNLPLVGTLEMYQRWHRLDPADDDEKARNDNIARVQGNRNPYIDNPDLADRLSNFNNLGR